MNPQMIQAAKELRAQTGIHYLDCLHMVRGVWTMLTGHPVYTDPCLEDLEHD